MIETRKFINASIFSFISGLFGNNEFGIGNDDLAC